MADDDVLRHQVALLLRPQVPDAQHITAAQGIRFQKTVTAYKSTFAVQPFGLMFAALLQDRVAEDCCCCCRLSKICVET